MSEGLDLGADHGSALPLSPAGPVGVRVRYDDPDAAARLHRGMAEVLATFPAPLRGRRVYLCIGTDRSTGDCLGPLVGSMLREAGVPAERVYGTLADPVHAANLGDRLKQGLCLGEGREPALVVAVDACLGQARSIGAIALGLGPLRPGAGVNKDLPPVGDIHVTGTVNVGGFMEYFVLQNTRLYLVMDMARVIVDALTRAERDPVPAGPRRPPLRRFFPLR